MPLDPVAALSRPKSPKSLLLFSIQHVLAEHGWWLTRQEVFCSAVSMTEQEWQALVERKLAAALAGAE